MSFHENLTRVRRARGITQEELAAQLNISRQAVSKWETGESLPDLHKLASLADVLGVTTDALCGRAGAETPAAEAVPAEAPAVSDAAKKIKSLRRALALLLAVCILLTALTARALVRERTYAALLRASEEAAPLPDTIEVSGLNLRPDGAALVVSFVPSVSGEGIEWSVGVAPEDEFLSVTTTTENGICTARIVNLSLAAPATLSATVTNGLESRSVCLATQVSAGGNMVSWNPEV